MRKTTAAVTGAAVLASGAFAVQSATGAGTVNVGDNYFVRSSGVPSVSAKVRERVLFKWVGRKPHNVVVASGPSKFSSSTQTKGSYRTPRLKKGTYVIYCSVHGRSDQSMKIR